MRKVRQHGGLRVLRVLGSWRLGVLRGLRNLMVFLRRFGRRSSVGLGIRDVYLPWFPPSVLPPFLLVALSSVWLSPLFGEQVYLRCFLIQNSFSVHIASTFLFHILFHILFHLLAQKHIKTYTDPLSSFPKLPPKKFTTLLSALQPNPCMCRNHECRW